MQFGEWKGKDQEKSDAKILKIAGAEGELVRTYRNAHNEEVRISIICARLQDIFYHTPDRCYPAAGFEMQGDPQPEVFDCAGNVSAEFFTTSFLKSEATGTHTERGFWSWSGDGQWVAPKNPKLKFAGQQQRSTSCTSSPAIRRARKRRPIAISPATSFASSCPFWSNRFVPPWSKRIA